MKNVFKICITTVVFWITVGYITNAKEIHVSINGRDNWSGTLKLPLRTIQCAAEIAQPGDEIIVHAGTYREWVNPPRGGKSHTNRIVYKAASGERVEIKGSEIVTGWIHIEGDVWKTRLSNSFFGDFNPFSDLIKGDWFDDKNRQHHTGTVYLNGEWMDEAEKLEDVFNPVSENPMWFALVDDKNTTIHAKFKGVNPNEHLVEVNVRQKVFYPDQIGRNYITVCGFIMCHAATPWAPPTAEQIGLIGTHWSKGWVIENNVISHSRCSGLTLGKYGDEWDNYAATADAYNKAIDRALENGWNKETVGGHLVRNNHISHCEMGGIIGSLGAIGSTISGNTIHDIHVRQLFSGAEMSAIKLHGAIDVEIIGNHIHHSFFALWLDWMAQGARVSKNLFHDNIAADLFMEVNHGPFIVDNNVLLSPVNMRDWSQGGVYAHNLMTGTIEARTDLRRDMPFHLPHSTTVAGLSKILGGDNRYFNNILVGQRKNPSKPAREIKPGHRGADGYGLWVYDEWEIPTILCGNVYYNEALPGAGESDPIVDKGFDPKVTYADGYLQLSLNKALKKADTKLVTTEILGKAKIPGLPYENSDGTLLRIDTDFFGKQRNKQNPTPGPFENPQIGSQRIKVML